MFQELNTNSHMNVVEYNPIRLQNAYRSDMCNGNSVHHHDMDTEHSELSEPSSSPSRNSESPFAPMPDTPDVDNENGHQLSSMSSDCMDPPSSPLCNGGDTLSPQESMMDNLDRSELQTCYIIYFKICRFSSLYIS